MTDFPNGIPVLARPTSGDAATGGGATDATVVVDKISDNVEALAASAYRGGVNARDFGATGDGLTNDAAALNAAMSAAVSSGRGLVFLPPGTYMVGSSVNLLSDVELRGAGQGASTIKARSGFSGLAVLDYAAGGRSRVTVADLTVDGSKSTISGSVNGINLPTSSHVRLSRVTVQNTRTRGIHLYQTDDVQIVGCTVKDCGVGNDGDTGTYAAIAVDGDRLVVSDCIASGASGLGIVLSGQSNDVAISGCVVTNPGYIGIGLGGAACERVAVSGCTVSGAGGPGVDTGNARHSQVSGCVVADSYAGFVSDSGRWQSFTGCRVDRPTTWHGFDITATSDSNVTGCAVYVGDAGVGRGFQVVDSNRTTLSGCSVVDPHPDYAAFHVYASNYVTVSGCRVDDERTPASGSAAFEVASTSSHVTTVGCSASRITGAKYVDTATGGSNVVHMTATGTPEGVIDAGIGSTWTRTDGGTGTTFYVKESGTGSTGWVAK